MKTVIVWFRNDLRINDHPALATAAADADQVIPLFIFDDKLLSGRHSSPNRNRFLAECLTDLNRSLQSLGSNLVIKQGEASQVLAQLSQELKASAVYYTADYTPYAISRDKVIKQTLGSNDILFRGFPGRLIVSSFDKLQTKTKTTYKVFTPFYRNWLEIGRRDIAPTLVTIPQLPKVSSMTVDQIKLTDQTDDLSPDVLPGGEIAGRERLKDWLNNGLGNYKEDNNDLGINGTSRLSSYLHFGCLSPLEIEAMLPPTTGAQAWRRQLAWREFYNYILFHYPNNAQREFQSRFRQLKWDDNPDLLKAWQNGTTGYPIIDAAMRQLKQEGWMHNRARLIVGSFLTKDLWLDWRLGEQYFMRWLLDGDEANNNGNWQWITSVGVDPAPVFRRLYNPASQQNNHDPKGIYVRKYVPELKNVPNEFLAQPWKMPTDIQTRSGCVIGQNYPAPIVDHALARQQTLERFRQTAAI